MATETCTHTSWHDTREQAEAAVQAEAARCGGTLRSYTITQDIVRLRLDLEIEPESWRGKTGYVEHVYDCWTDDGHENFNVWTDDGHVAGSFPSAAAARRWAKKEGVRVRPGITRRSAGTLAKGRRGAIGKF
jgi:hypothetical protein